jgi:hypothetical protein
MNENRIAGSFVIRIVMGILGVVWFVGGLILGPLTVRAIIWDAVGIVPLVLLALVDWRLRRGLD